MLNVFVEEEEGWVGGEIEGRIGYFPKDYVLPVGDKLNDRMIKVYLSNTYTFC